MVPVRRLLAVEAKGEVFAQATAFLRAHLDCTMADSFSAVISGITCCHPASAHAGVDSFLLMSASMCDQVAADYNRIILRGGLFSSNLVSTVRIARQCCTPSPFVFSRRRSP
jgi:hypothetical protein